MIRKIEAKDRDLFYALTNEFYNSDSVLSPIPFKNHKDTFNELMASDNYISGYILTIKNNDAGYALTSKYYSHEAGGLTLFVEELFVLEQYRSMGLGKEFFEYLMSNNDSKIVRLRLEVESKNRRAIDLYSAQGFAKLDYNQMIKDI